MADSQLETRIPVAPVQLRAPASAPSDAEPAGSGRSRSYGKIGWRVGASLLLLCSVALGGCGNAIYAVQVSSASSKLEEARELRAEELSPYEYYMAVEHLQKARSEAAEADYGDAIVFAEVCEEHAEKAIRISREAHRSAGR